MKICFCLSDLWILQNQLGSDFARMADSLLQAGHQVLVFSAVSDHRLDRYDPKPLENLAHYQPFDVLVAVEDWIPLLTGVIAQKKFYWTYGGANEFSNFGVGDERIASRLQGILTLNQSQAAELAKASGLSMAKMIVPDPAQDFDKQWISHLTKITS